jgi:hypothetical protein
VQIALEGLGKKVADVIRSERFFEQLHSAAEVVRQEEIV